MNLPFVAAMLRRSLLLLCPLLLWQCDTQKFIDFDYDARPLARTVEVAGIVSNVFTGEPVPSAQLSFEGQLTSTDENGEYDGHYLLSLDDNANRPVPIYITAEKYFPLDTSLIVFPVRNQLNAQMTYAAPILLSGVLGSDRIATAIIFDYQGVDNIDSVFALGWYDRGDGPRVRFYHPEQMTLVRQIDQHSAEYQVALPHITWAALVTSRIRFRMVDRDGFEEDKLIIF